MHQLITKTLPLHKIDWNLVFLLSIPFILLAANQEWLFPYGHPTDAWIAKRYLLETGHDYSLTGEVWGSMYENYKAARISWSIKGLLVHKLFSPVMAHYILHLSMFCLFLGTFYLIVKNLFNKHVAFISSVAFGTYSQFHATMSFEWDYTTHDAGLNILLTMLFMLFASQSKKWKLWLVLAGATWVSALQSIYLGTYIPAVTFWYLYLNQKHLHHPIIASTMYIFAGAAAATLLYCIISYLLGGPFLFFAATLEPIISFSSIYSFHSGYWLPLSTLLKESKSIVFPILGGFIALSFLAINVIKRKKNKLIDAIMLTQYTLLIGLLVGSFLHFIGHGMMTNDHMLAPIAPFVFLSVAGLYALLLRSANITNSSNVTIINTMKAAILFIFCGALIFYQSITTFIRTNIITFIKINFFKVTNWNDLENNFLIYLINMPRTTALLIAGITVCSVIVILVILANKFMRRHTLGVVVVLSLALSGFLSILNTQTTSIAKESYDISNKCGTRKDQYKSIIDVFFKLRPYNLKSESVRKTQNGIILREPLLWYKNNAVLKHPDMQCREFSYDGTNKGYIDLTRLYGGVLGIRGYTVLGKEMLLESYLLTGSFSSLQDDKLATLPKQSRIAIFYSDQEEIQTALATLKSHGLKIKILDQSQIKNGAVSFRLAVLNVKKDARTKAKYRN